MNPLPLGNRCVCRVWYVYANGRRVVRPAWCRLVRGLPDGHYDGFKREYYTTAPFKPEQAYACRGGRHHNRGGTTSGKPTWAAPCRPPGQGRGHGQAACRDGGCLDSKSSSRILHGNGIRGVLRRLAAAWTVKVQTGFCRGPTSVLNPGKLLGLKVQAVFCALSNICRIRHENGEPVRWPYGKVPGPPANKVCRCVASSTGGGWGAPPTNS